FSEELIFAPTKLFFRLAMSSSDRFLALPGTKRKRPAARREKKPAREVSKSAKSTGKRRGQRDEPSSAESEDDEIGPGGIDDFDVVGNKKRGEEGEEATDESDVEETPAERRLRLAKEYLEQVKREAVGTDGPPFFPSLFSVVAEYWFRCGILCRG